MSWTASKEGWPVGHDFPYPIETPPGVPHPVSPAPGRHGHVGYKEGTQKWSESWCTSPTKTH